MTPDPHPASLSFTLTGRVKPAVRMTRRGMWVSEQAQEYLENRAALSWQLKAQMKEREMMPPHTPLAVEITFCCAGGIHHMDLDNMAKNLIDSASGIVFADDRWIDSITATRQKWPQDVTTLMVWAL